MIQPHPPVVVRPYPVHFLRYPHVASMFCTAFDRWGLVCSLPRSSSESSESVSLSVSSSFFSATGGGIFVVVVAVFGAAAAVGAGEGSRWSVSAVRSKGPLVEGVPLLFFE